VAGVVADKVHAAGPLRLDEIRAVAEFLVTLALTFVSAALPRSHVRQK